MTPPAPSDACRRLLLQLSKYVDGELSPARRQRLERHLSACACCTAMADQIRETIAAYRAAGKQPLPDEVRRRARSRIRKLLASS